MNPMTALQLARTLGGEARSLYVVGCEPAVLETEEIGLSEPVRAAVPGAIALIEDLLGQLLEKQPASEASQSNQTQEASARRLSNPVNS
jgi:hydrogenase maturation protease